MADRPGEAAPVELVVTESSRSRRELVESVAVAIILAFLFRAFEAEAFVIPTGSMAPTLQGRHKDVVCPECGYRYQGGDSIENEVQGHVVAVVCPMCFFNQEIDPLRASHASNTGDRILVNKLAYEAPFGEPERWDVIVFKYPHNAKQNYIKRLVGLDKETIRIRHGDIYARDDTQPQAEFRIVRKPANKLMHMLQAVNDTHYRSTTLDEYGWPSNWQVTEGEAWQTQDRGRTFTSAAKPEASWVRYEHHYLNFDIWSRILQTLTPGGDPNAQRIQAPVIPITDFYAYNGNRREFTVNGRPQARNDSDSMGLHWVGDLAVEAEVEITSDTGVLSLDIVEAGRHHRCDVDVSTGRATLTIQGGTPSTQATFQDAKGETYAQVVAETPIRGRGEYTLRFANVDNQLTLWVNGEVASFDRDTTYSATEADRPFSTAADRGDLQPIGVGATNLAMNVNRLRVLRDIYYIATDQSRGVVTDYPLRDEGTILRHLANPQQWTEGDLFDRRMSAEFQQKADQFFALGDNSPQSQDSRLWMPQFNEFSPHVAPGTSIHHVDRDLLIGEAVLIYWPHPLLFRIPGTRTMVPWFPNFREMEMIH